jgi:hypothetical protein
MKLIYSLLFSLTTLSVVFGQKIPDSDALHRVIINHKDSIVYAAVLPSLAQERVRARDRYMYHWYAAHDIKKSRGGFDGKLLHGQYSEFYSDKSLKEKGIFRKGLKRGKWKAWYTNGQFREIVRYKKGRKHGTFREYSPEGTLLRKGSYHKDYIKGRVKKYQAQEGITTEKYKKGVLVVKKEKPVKARKAEKEGKASKKTKNKKKNTKEEESLKEEQPLKEEEKTEKQRVKGKKKKEKEPTIRLRKSIQIVPQQPGKST